MHNSTPISHPPASISNSSSPVSTPRPEMGDHTVGTDRKPVTYNPIYDTPGTVELQNADISNRYELTNTWSDAVTVRIQPWLIDGKELKFSEKLGIGSSAKGESGSVDQYGLMQARSVQRSLQRSTSGDQSAEINPWRQGNRRFPERIWHFEVRQSTLVSNVWHFVQFNEISKYCIFLWSYTWTKSVHHHGILCQGYIVRCVEGW